MIYVGGLPDTITVEDLSSVFGSIGQIKFDQKKNQDKIWHGLTLRIVVSQCPLHTRRILLPPWPGHSCPW